MKIAIAPDSYKESLTALQVATEIEAGFREIFPCANYVKLPIADGGEGTVEALVAATQGTIIRLMVTGPLGEPVNAFYGLSGDKRSVFIEMAAASGLQLVPPARRNPLITTSRGTGELILSALNQGVRHIIIGIGGSATNDGGAGMIQALGGRLLNNQGEQIAYGGGALSDLVRIDMSEFEHRIAGCHVEVACDVSGPLTGPDGASLLFGSQKGASPEQVKWLENALGHYGKVIHRDLNIEVNSLRGAAAAGGMGAALYAFCQAELRPGAELVTKALGLDTEVKDATLVITGEGCIDSQTLQGKAPLAVVKVAKRFNKPVIAIAGSLTDAHIVHQYGLDAVYSVIYNITTLEDALNNAAKNVRLAARNIAATLAIGQQF